MRGSAMSKILLIMLMGYLLGSLNPAAFISMLKKKNLREMGTGNLGATNTMLTFGKKYGVMVMLFDVIKAVISVNIAKLVLPKMILAGITAGVCTMIGHIFPFYLNFQGGKGVAAFAGTLLAIDPFLFQMLLVICIVIAIWCNYAAAAPVSAAVLAPIIGGIRAQSAGVFFLFLIAGVLIIFKHLKNFEKIQNGTEMKISDFVKSHFRESCEM